MARSSRPVRPRRKRGTASAWALPLPPGSDITPLCQLRGPDTFVLCAPLTPSGNRYLRTHHQERDRYRKRLAGFLVPIIRATFARSRVRILDEAWALEAELAVVRCSLASKAADTDNVVAGCKALVDTLVEAGVLKDDSQKELRWASVKDEPKGSWTWPGPGTWIVVQRVHRVLVARPAP